MGSYLLWSKAGVWAWVAILIALAGYECWALLSGDMATPPLTRVTIKYVPWYVTVPFLVWLLIHFAVRYSNHAYVSSLRG